MKKYNYLSLIIILLFFFIAPDSLLANYKGTEKDGGKKRTTPLQKTAVDPYQSLININNTTMWVTDAGLHDWVIGGSYNGSFPSGTQVGAIFSEGLVWGGQVYDGSQPLIRVAGNTYQSGTFPVTRLFRVRPDYLTANLASDAASFFQVELGQVSEGQIQEIRDQYAKDWAEWPADQGALYEDVDGDGEYNPEVDIPGIPGAAQTIFIKYDDRNSSSQYGSPPIGLEVSTHYWAYAYSGALGNIIFKKVDLVYKGTSNSAPNSRIDSMYIVQWSDPDVGTAGNDFAGCDTTLNMGYAYNSTPTDPTYASIGLAPPAAGYDFLQGVSQFTGNPNDSAIFDLKWRKGYKYVNRKPMSSFVYFAAGGNWSDPGFDYEGTLEFYNLMRGKLPIPRYPSGSPFPDNVVDYSPDGGTYLLAGNPNLPASGTNKIDGVAEPNGDRRLMVTNGPINMRLGDTAQVVVALVYGQGTDNLKSIDAMKTNDATAQIVFDQLFQLPNIAPPKVSVAQLDNKVILNWGFDGASVEKIETFSSQGYDFEGYEVYQVPSVSSSLSDGILVGTFDLVNGVKAIYDVEIDANGQEIPVLAANGQDKGVERVITLTTDLFRKQPLRNGQEYYFVVVSYAYNANPLLPFHVLRSPFVIYRGVPQSPAPGDRYTSNAGDTILVTKTAGSGDGQVVVTVVDPTQLTGHDYKVTFQTDSHGETTWSLIDITLDNTVVLSGQMNQSGDNDYLTPDGIQVKVIGPPPGMKEWQITGTRRFSWAGGFTGLGLEGFSGPDPTAYDQEHGTIGMAGHFAFGGIGTTLSDADYKTVELRLAPVSNSTKWDPLAPPSDPNFSKAYRWLRAVGTGVPAQPEFAPWIINAGSGYPYQDYNYGVPFSAWNMETDPPTRLSVGMFENNVVNGLVDGRYWPYNANSTIDNTVAREFAFIFSEPYSETPNPAFQVNLFSNADLPMMWVMVCQRRNDNTWVTGDVFTIVANHPNTSEDVFTFTTPPAKTSSLDLAKKDIEKINVFPNPYYGYQYRETSPDNKYVTFSHLPDDAIIRIFDLSGVLVRTIVHNPINGQFERWNLQNENGYPVASGIYVVYVDMPSIGSTKVLKAAVIQEQQMLKTY